MTRANCMWRLPLRDGAVSKAGVFAYLPGIHGPDGLAVDEAGKGRLTNIAYGGPDRKTLFITDSYRSAILKAQLPVGGMELYSHA